MNTILRTLAAAAVAASLVPPPAAAQSFEDAGTRASGMGGAFVAVADDASAAYWNPAGFAAGSYFSLVLDAGSSKVSPSTGAAAGSQSSWLLALGAPMLGLSHYRLRSSTVADAPIAVTLGNRNPSVEGALVRLNTLVTHHTGATLVQSITDAIAVGATLKLVRGFAASATRAGGGDHEALLDEANALGSTGSNKFDADLGLMASLGRIKAGLTVRNVTEPEFAAAGDGGTRRLERQARAGVAVRPVQAWLVAADLDLLGTAGALGELRNLSVGAEGQIVRRTVVRGGLRFHTTAPAGIGRSPTVSIGSSYAVTKGVQVDAQVTAGSDRAARGWGISGRFVY